MTAEEIKKDAELEGKKLDDEKTEEAAGGWVKGEWEMYTEEMLLRVGIICSKNVWGQKEYSVYGVKISKEQAEAIAYKAMSLNPVRPLTKEELAQYFGINC